MKKIILLILAILSSVKTDAQIPYEFEFFPCGGFPTMAYEDFETNLNADHFYFDSTQTNNLWQIGAPLKIGFIPALEGTRSLITDTALNYPINNISSFYIKIIVHCPHPYGTKIQFLHKFSSDTTIDGGTIEISHDNGNSWINLIDDPLLMYPNELYSSTDTIQSLGWKPGFSGNINSNYVMFEINTSEFSDDTLVFKFTFASDSIETNKEGWMIDEMYLMAWGSEIEEYNLNSQISVFPNPTSDKIYFASKIKIQKPFEVNVFNQLGELVLQKDSKENEDIDISNLNTGIYFCSFRNESFYATKKIIVQK